MRYKIHWSKTYYASGTKDIEADTSAKAKSIAEELIGDWTGSMQYNPDENQIEVTEDEKEESSSKENQST